MIIVLKDFDFGFMIVKMLSAFGEFYLNGAKEKPDRSQALHQ